MVNKENILQQIGGGVKFITQIGEIKDKHNLDCIKKKILKKPLYLERLFLC